MKKYLSTILLLLPLLLLPLNWYSNLKSDPNTYQPLASTGIDVLSDHGFRIGLIFLCVILIQIFSVKCNTIIFSVSTKLLLCIALGLYPAAYWENFSIIKNFIFEFYSIGFYLSILFIISSAILDTVFHRKRNNSGSIAE